MPYLFDPQRVTDVLANFPALESVLPSTASEGVPSSFTGWRKTDRAIYRLLANPHYEHLLEFLRAIETLIAAGCDLRDVIATPDSNQFSSFRAEIWVADHLLERGFEVEMVRRANHRTPDVSAARGDLDATIEVFSPRVWQMIDDWDRQLTDAVKNLDEPFDFCASLGTRAPYAFHPWQIARALDLTAENVLQRVVHDFTDAVRDGNVGWSTTYPHGDTGLETEVELQESQPTAEGPARWLSGGGPGLGGYDPIGVFKRVVHRNVLRRKAGRRQTEMATTRLRGMVVDLTRTQIAVHLQDGPRKEQAAEIVDDIDVTAVGLDFIAFCMPKGLRRGINVDFIARNKATMSPTDVAAMF